MEFTHDLVQLLVIGFRGHADIESARFLYSCYLRFRAVIFLYWISSSLLCGDLYVLVSINLTEILACINPIHC